MKKILTDISINPRHLERSRRHLERSREILHRFLHFSRNDMLIFGFLILWFFGVITPVHAQSVTLSVSPPVVEILLAPNKKVEQTFTLQTTGENLEITPELHLVKPSDSSGHMIIDPNPLNPSSIPLTLTLSPPIHDLQSTIYNLTIEAPNTDLPQDIYLALIFRTSPPSTIYDLRSTITTPAISALILVTIAPTGLLPINLEIKDFSPPALHDSWLPLTLSPLLHNNTSIMIRPEGLYEIISPSGKTIFSLPLYPHLILGNSSRLLQADTPGVKGSHTPGVLTFTPPWSTIGPHTLRLTVTTEGGTQITQLEKTIWLLPLRVIVLTLTLIITFLTLLSKRSKYEAERP